MVQILARIVRSFKLEYYDMGEHINSTQKGVGNSKNLPWDVTDLDIKTQTKRILTETMLDTSFLKSGNMSICQRLVSRF